MAVDPTMPVLVVDDADTMRKILHRLLQQIGFRNIHSAPDGFTALQKLREKNFLLVISDWNMEGMSGLQLLEQVRADSKLRNVRFILISSEAKADYVAAAREAGANSYIVKPFLPEALKAKIEDAFLNS